MVACERHHQPDLIFHGLVVRAGLLPAEQHADDRRQDADAGGAAGQLGDDRADIEAVYVAANAIAEEFGTTKMLNMVMIGAMLQRRPVLEVADVARALEEHLPPNKAHLIEANLKVLQRGYDVALPLAT